MVSHPSAKNTAQEHYRRGVEFQKNGRTDEAMAAFEAAINEDFSCDPAFAAAGDIFFAQGAIMQAADCYACAVRAKPGADEYKRKFAQAIAPFRFSQRNEDLRTVILQCLEAPGLDCSGLGGVWASDVRLSPAYAALHKKTSDPEGFAKILRGPGDYSLLRDVFFLRGLERLAVYDLEFEKFLTALRRFLLEDESARSLKISDQDREALVRALARYCDFTEYIFDVTDDEKKLLENVSNPALKLCYAPAGAYETRDDIARITEIEDKVSQAVQGQYEIFPYPRWQGFDPEIRSAAIEGRLQGARAKILIAGCGTGKEAVELASVFPDAQVLAVDLSRASLSYGLGKAEAFGVKNLTFGHADILGLGVLEEKFDYITSSGVLHHMKEPLDGWQVLTGLLKPGGLMRIALYSAAARREITAARGIIAREAISPDADGIRDFRRRASRLLKKKTFENITNFRDYYSMSECRDLLFHVQEHCFTMPQIADALEGLGLRFLGFYLPQDTLERYARMFPKDKGAVDLRSWAAFEDKNPDTFAGMYRFWCERI